MPTEIACDESGSEGGNLIGGVTDVFAHASVLLASESADACIRELRDRIRSPALEYKANHLLREKHRDTLVWLLSTAGPIHGRARVHLTEKAFFVARTAAELLGRHSLYEQGPAALKAANDALRENHRLRLDLHIPAIVAAVHHWGAAGDTVEIVHDRQNLLTVDRLSRLRELLGDRLADLRFVDSRDDSRVQIADFLAGVARRIASDELNGHGDAELTELLRSYVDPASSWGDDRSWTALKPS